MCTEKMEADRDRAGMPVARRSFAADTIFIALVICCVLRIEPIRLRMALSVAIKP